MYIQDLNIDAVETAEREIGLWFKELNLTSASTKPLNRCGGDGGAGDRLMVQRRRHKVAAAF